MKKHKTKPKIFRININNSEVSFHVWYDGPSVMINSVMIKEKIFKGNGISHTTRIYNMEINEAREYYNELAKKAKSETRITTN